MLASTSAPFCGEARFISWNARALFCYDPLQLHRKLDFVCGLSAGADAIMIQEAHSNAEKATILEDRLRDTHDFWWCNALDDATLGGVGFIVKRLFLARFRHVTPVTIIPARAMLLELRGDEGALNLCCIHVDPALNTAGKKQFLDNVRRAIPVNDGVHSILCGDFNYDSDVHDRMDCEHGHYCGSPGPVQAKFDQLFGDLAELDTQDFTHRNMRDDAVVAFSRIDRVYTSLHPALCQEIAFAAGVVHPVKSPRFDLSDHVPIRFAMTPTPLTGRNTMPPWITRHPLWQSELQASLNELGPLPEEDHNLKIKMTKVAMRMTVKKVIEISQHHRARNADEELWWLVRALRAIRLNMPEKLDQCCTVVGILSDLLDTQPGDLSRLLARITELSRRSAAEKLQEIQANAELSEYARKQKVARIARLVRTWAPSRRNVQLQGVRKDDGSLAEDHDDVFEEVARHWQPVFAAKTIDEEAATDFLTRWARAFPTVSWTLSFELFREVVSHTSDSGCGPDGVPYSAWKYAGEQTHRVLYEWYRAWLGGLRLSDDANHALLALIPKQAEPQDATHGLYRHPKNLRPLSLSNTDVKLLALALSAVVAPTLPAWARTEQKGFISGRLITQNVIDIESHAIQAALRTSLGPGPEQLCNPVAVFFDFGAAFPSLAQRFLWILLAAIGFPPEVVKALQELYRDNLHYWRFKNVLRALFKVESGVKQGCPFSTALFVLAMDPFIAALAASIGPRGCLRVYADDIAVVLWRLVEQAPQVDRLFVLWALISALRIRNDKCVIVPLWTKRLERVRTVIADHVPFWCAFALALAAKYLGFHIGPNSHLHEWPTAIAKYRSRAENLIKVEEGLLATIHLHNIQALPVLYYLAQLRDLPHGMASIQEQAIERLTRGPRDWLPDGAGYHLDTLFGFPAHFYRMETMDLAIKGRVAHSSLEWRPLYRELTNLRMHDDLALHPPCADWLERSAVVTLNRAEAAVAAACSRARVLASGDKGQTRLYSAIRTARASPALEHLLRKRWDKRWSRQLTVAAPMGTIVRRASLCISRARVSLPPFLIAALFTTWFNGWCTARRFQQRRFCAFCASGEDSIEHLACCRSLKDLFRHHLRIEHRNLAEFLCIGSEAHDLPARALAIHAAKAVVEATNLAGGLHAASPQARFRAELQRSVAKWPNTRRYVQSWTLSTTA